MGGVALLRRRSRFDLAGRWRNDLDDPTPDGFRLLLVARTREPGAFIVEVDLERQTVSSPGTDDDATLGEMDGGEWYGPLEQPE